MGKIPAAFTDIARRRVFGRRLGRPLGSERQEVIDSLLPSLSVPEELVTQQRDMDLNALFAKPQPVVYEIGFGNGEHTKALMETHPDRNYIAAEPFINGMSAFLKSIRDMDQGNIRVWMDDAITLIRSFPDESLDMIYILNPDPWPKKKHNKRRIVREETLIQYHRTLKPGGRLIMATDVDELAEWMVTETLNHGGFNWEAERSADWKTMPSDWMLTTRYAAKGVAAGRTESYLLFRKS
jgi:tRNA (guanine-N7-)-methyltransferase